MEPTLPISIKVISINLLFPDSSLVIPCDSPVLLNVENTSKTTFSKGSLGSNESIKKTESPIHINEAKIIAKDLLIDVFLILRFWMISWFLPFARDQKFKTITENVVVLTPPPVPPGEAPIHIRKIKSK